MSGESGSKFLLCLVDLFEHSFDMLLFLIELLEHFLSKDIVLQETIGGLPVELFDEDGDVLTCNELGFDDYSWILFFASIV